MFSYINLLLLVIKYKYINISLFLENINISHIYIMNMLVLQVARNKILGEILHNGFSCPPISSLLDFVLCFCVAFR